MYTVLREAYIRALDRGQGVLAYLTHLKCQKRFYKKKIKNYPTYYARI
jgi:hypothetical protein